MSNIPGLNIENILLIFLSYALILKINKKTNSDSAILFVVILTFHHAVAYLYAFYMSRPQNELDPAGFMLLADECSLSGYCGYFGQHLYANYLAKIFSLGQTVYFVFLLNILYFVISLYFFIRISEILNLKGNRKIYIFLYSMWPSVVYFTTLNYREPFELYLLIIGIYFGLTGSKSDNYLRMLTSMIILSVMGFFHTKGLLFLAPILFLILVSYKFKFTLFSAAKKLSLLILMTVLVYFSQSMYSDYLYEVSILKQKAQEKYDRSRNRSLAQIIEENTLSGDRLIYEEKKNAFLKNKNYPATYPGYIDIFMRKVTFYRASLNWIAVPRTAFVSIVSDSSIPAFIATYFLVYLEYLFSPFLFQVNSLLSLLAYAESVLRLFLFVSALMLLKRYPQVRILFIIYLAITAMWAIGVVSYGASIRHHIQTNWILVLLGVPVISEYISGKLRIKNSKMDIISR